MQYVTPVYKTIVNISFGFVMGLIALMVGLAGLGAIVRTDFTTDTIAPIIGALTGIGLFTAAKVRNKKLSGFDRLTALAGGIIVPYWVAVTMITLLHPGSSLTSEALTTINDMPILVFCIFITLGWIPLLLAGLLYIRTKYNLGSRAFALWLTIIILLACVLGYFVATSDWYQNYATGHQDILDIVVQLINRYPTLRYLVTIIGGGSLAGFGWIQIRRIFSVAT